MKCRGRKAGAAEIEKKVFVIAHRLGGRGWAIGSLILPDDWLYLAGHDPHPSYPGALANRTSRQTAPPAVPSCSAISPTEKTEASIAQDEKQIHSNLLTLGGLDLQH